MSIVITNGRAVRDGRSVAFKKSPNVGGALKPEYIVLHDTASGLNSDGPISWLTNPASKVSAHVVIGRDGTITQLVPFDVKAWHAGQSVWKGRPLLNGFSVGIEIVNPGKMVQVSDGVYKGVATYDIKRNPELIIKRAKTNAHGDGYWMAYTPAQIAAVKELCEAICQEYAIKEILTHWLISPGRKVDTNPLFPLEEVRAAVSTSRPVKPVALVDVGTDLDESDGVAPNGDDYDASHGSPDKDERDPPTFFRRASTWIKTGLTGIGFGGIGALTDWQVAAITFGFVLLMTVLGVGFTLWFFGKEPVREWVRKQVA